MASRASSALVLLALFAAALVSLQVALADEASNAELVIGWKDADVGSNVSPAEGLEVEETDLDEGHGMTTEDQVTRVGAHPLERILFADGETKCWTNRHCKELVKSGACCNRRCSDLDTSNTNCGQCNKPCNRRGYACKAGQCVKPPTTATCAVTGKCGGGKTCCKGQCQNLQTDASNCGWCDRKCGWGLACCGRECKKLEWDGNNCGQCGRRCVGGTVCCNSQCVNLKMDNGNCNACGTACGFGRSCCNGNCVATLSDKNNCGGCGRHCGKNVKCQFGICGYGH